MIPLISEVIVVLEADYIHSRDNEQGVLCVGEVKFPPTELDHLVRLGQFSRKFLLKMFHTGNCDSGSSDGHIIFPEIPTVPSIANMNAWTKGTFYTSNRSQLKLKSSSRPQYLLIIIASHHCESYYSLCHGWMIPITAQDNATALQLLSGSFNQ